MAGWLWALDGYEMSGYDAADGDLRSLLLVLQLEGDAGSDEAELLGRQLRAELVQLDIEAAIPVSSGAAPEGAKGAAADWSALVVTFSVAGGVFTSVIAVARDWLARHGSAQRITMTIDNDAIVLDHASAQEREELISTWVRRHSAG